MNKMILKKLLLLSFLFYVFNTIFSIPHELTQLGIIDPFKKNYTTKISKISFNVWAGLCEISIGYLRQSIKEYSNVYVNYGLFSNSSIKYDSILVRFPSGRERPRTVLYCYSRPSVVRDNVLPVHHEHLNDIAIILLMNVSEGTCPRIENTVYIFRRQENTERPIYVPVHPLTQLHNCRSVPDYVLSHPAPASVTTYINSANAPLNAANLKFRSCSNKKNVLEIIELKEFIKLCVWMFRQEKFKNEFVVSSLQDDYEGVELRQRTNIYIQENNMIEALYTDVHTCKGRYIRAETSDTQVENYKYALASTEFDDRVIICKTMSVLVDGDRHWYFHAVEMITNLDEDYLKLAP